MKSGGKVVVCEVFMLRGKCGFVVEKNSCRDCFIGFAMFLCIHTGFMAIKMFEGIELRDNSAVAILS
jgi:hypothetical protein